MSDEQAPMDNPKYRPFVRARLDGAGTREAARKAGYAATPSQYAIDLFNTASDLEGRDPDPASFREDVETVNEKIEALREERRTLKRHAKAAEILQARSKGCA